MPNVIVARLAGRLASPVKKGQEVAAALLLDARPEGAQAIEPVLGSVARDLRSIDRADRRADNPIGLDACFVHCFVNTDLVRYWVDSVKFIFQSAIDEAGAAATTETAQRIVTYLTERGQATRTELTKGCFGGHVSKATLAA